MERWSSSHKQSVFVFLYQYSYRYDQGICILTYFCCKIRKRNREKRNFESDYLKQLVLSSTIVPTTPSKRSQRIQLIIIIIARRKNRRVRTFFFYIHVFLKIQKQTKKETLSSDVSRRFVFHIVPTTPSERSQCSNRWVILSSSLLLARRAPSSFISHVFLLQSIQKRNREKLLSSNLICDFVFHDRSDDAFGTISAFQSARHHRSTEKPRRAHLLLFHRRISLSRVFLRERDTKKKTERRNETHTQHTHTQKKSLLRVFVVSTRIVERPIF